MELQHPSKPIVKNGYVSKKEVFGFCFGGFGQNMIYMLVSTYIMFFFTEIAMIGVAAATVITVIARVWDAINDMIMGSIVDNTKPNKYGKFRPYLLATPILMATFTILCFTNLGSHSPLWLRIVWCGFTYIMWGMCYTVSDIPMWGLTAAISPLPEERTKFLNLAKVLCSLGGMAGMILLPMIIEGIGKYEAKAYLTAALVFGLIGSAMFLTMGTMCREKVVATPKNKSFKENLQMLKNNKPLFMIFIAGILSGCRALAQMAATYVVTYVYQGTELQIGSMVIKGMNLQLVIAAGFGAGLFIGMMLVPVLQKKLDNKKIFIYSSILAFVVQLVLFFIPYKYIIAVSVILFFAGLPYGIYLVLIGAMLIDCVQYYEWQTGERTEGFCFSIQTFMTKLGAGIAVGVTGLALMISGYRGPKTVANTPSEWQQFIYTGGEPVIQAGETVNIFTQSASTLNWIYALITIIPAISCIISIIPILKYDLTGSKMKEINDELAQRREGLSDNTEVVAEVA